MQTWYSTPWNVTIMRGTLQLYSCTGHFLHTVSFHSPEGEPPPPRSTPWGAIQVCHLMLGSTSLSFSLSVQHSLTHSLMADRTMVVGYVLTDHTCSFYVHQSHRHDSTQPSHYTSWVALCEPLVCSYDISHSRAWQASITSLAASSVA